MQADDARRADDEAAEWQLRLHNGEADESDRDFIEWLAASPAHRAAMDRAQTIWSLIGENAASPEIVKGRRDALHRSGRTAARRWSRFQSSSPALKLTAAAALFVLVALPVLIAWDFNGRTFRLDAGPARETFETGVGESRIVTLEDNSRVTLDAATRLSVAYSARARDIVLEQGQAYFDVARDKSRPFRVAAGNQIVLATGTAFNVEMIGEEVLVTLLEGSVVVSEAASAAPRASAVEPSAPVAPVKLKQGEQLIVSGAETPQVEAGANLERISAWRDGKVFLQGDTLAEAVERMNRYSRIRLSVVGEGMDDYRISGVFNAGDTDAFIGAIEAYFPVEARRTSSAEIEIHPRS